MGKFHTLPGTRPERPPLTLTHNDRIETTINIRPLKGSIRWELIIHHRDEGMAFRGATSQRCIQVAERYFTKPLRWEGLRGELWGKL